MERVILSSPFRDVAVGGDDEDDGELLFSLGGTPRARRTTEIVTRIVVARLSIHLAVPSLNVPRAFL